MRNVWQPWWPRSVPTLSLPRASSSGAIEFTVFNGTGQTNIIQLQRIWSRDCDQHQRIPLD